MKIPKTQSETEAPANAPSADGDGGASVALGMRNAAYAQGDDSAARVVALSLRDISAPAKTAVLKALDFALRREGVAGDALESATREMRTALEA